MTSKEVGWNERRYNFGDVVFGVSPRCSLFYTHLAVGVNQSNVITVYLYCCQFCCEISSLVFANLV